EGEESFCGTFAPRFFILACMSKTLRLPNCDEQGLLDQVQVRLVERAELERFKRLLDEHHYLGSLKAVGERLHYVATDAQGQWLALLVFSAPAKHLKHRDQWIGWSAAQRHRRLSLVTNNSRFLILPERSVPNLASKVLRMSLDRLATDWQSAYGHPVLVVEPSSMSPSSAGRFIRPAAGASLARPTAGAAAGAITTLNTTSPNASSAVNCAKTPAAVFRLNISSRHWRWSNKRYRHPAHAR